MASFSPLLGEDTWIDQARRSPDSYNKKSWLTILDKATDQLQTYNGCLLRCKGDSLDVKAQSNDIVMSSNSSPYVKTQSIQNRSSRRLVRMPTDLYMCRGRT